MSRKLIRIAVAICLTTCGACSTRVEPAVDTAHLPKIGVDFSLGEQEICKYGDRSPEIRLKDLPTGVVSYDVKMTDLDVPSYKHWNQTITSSESVIRAGAGADYAGPACPPNGHHYRISVLARNGQQQPIAYGEKTVTATRN